MSADSDYARIAELLSKQHLPAYVAYDSLARVNGLGNDSTRDRVVVRVRDGKVVAGSTHFKVQSDSAKVAQDSNPVSHPLFDPACYHATSERHASFEGKDVLELTLAATCKDLHTTDHNYPLTALYADPATLVPIEVNGTVPQDEDSKNVAVSLDERFSTYAGHVMPSSIKVDVSGSGLMFWLQVHVSESYTNYAFMNSYGR